MGTRAAGGRRLGLGRETASAARPCGPATAPAGARPGRRTRRWPGRARRPGWPRQQAALGVVTGDDERAQVAVGDQGAEGGRRHHLHGRDPQAGEDEAGPRHLDLADELAGAHAHAPGRLQRLLGHGAHAGVGVGEDGRPARGTAPPRSARSRGRTVLEGGGISAIAAQDGMARPMFTIDTATTPPRRTWPSRTAGMGSARRRAPRPPRSGCGPGQGGQAVLADHARSLLR